MSGTADTNEIWILGATGRTGRAIAARLVAAGEAVVLVGRDAARLGEVAGALAGECRTVVADGVEAIAALLHGARPAVVVNTIGPFTRTALPIARACPPGTHYVDLANELPAVSGLLGLRDEAVADGRCLVTGAGFGVLGTESVLLKLCVDGGPVTRVRVDALPSVAGEPGALGTALAASIVEGLAGGGRRYENGRLVRVRLGGDVERFTLPDGTAVHSGGVPSGELEAARRASGAPFVVAASGAVPAGRVVRALLPGMAALLSRRVIADFAVRRLAGIRVVARERGREFSWARARVDGPAGTRVGWLRTGEAMAFTASVAAEVARRLSRSELPPGAYTPGALFGPSLAEHAGARFILDE
jgi:short subunit dehydrogenase-like uncharacterized protein